MKSNYLPLIISLLVLACTSRDEDKYKDPIPMDEVPADVAPSKPCSTLYTSIMNKFKEHQNNMLMYPFLFTDTIQKEIVLKSESALYVTFISEGAGFANTLGYYAYDPQHKPSKASDIDLQVIFPHVSSDVLKQGDMVQLGTEKFKAGTVVGFFLVVRGWENGYVNLKKTIHYTDVKFNMNQYQQHILFKEPKCGDIVMAFEDKALNQDSDFDFNDVIFTISDNNQQLETIAIDLSKIPVVEP
jgi:hypothetical protein